MYAYDLHMTLIKILPSLAFRRLACIAVCVYYDFDIALHVSYKLAIIDIYLS
jgi:hypothetical protein